MLRITIPEGEYWDERDQCFIRIKKQALQLEHSLVSLSKWESKWCKAFLDRHDKSFEETVDYVRCMTLTQNVDPLAYKGLTDSNIEDINRYIDAPMTATYFSKEAKGRFSSEQVTAELIYYWMIALSIPFECQKWHLNRLLTLIRVCNIKSQSPRKMSRGSIMRRNAALNAARRKKHHTRG